jgi:hypothetical protein
MGQKHVLSGVQATFNSDILDDSTINQEAKEALIILIDLRLKELEL